MKTYLVTGGAGFIGSNFVLYMLKKYEDVRYPLNIQPCEDGLFSHFIFALTDKICLNEKGIYLYRQHDNQNHRTQKSDKILKDIPKWLDILDSFYEK